ncbi:replicative DNA helicase [Alicyclobacillus macrosporangiidus]|uniref:replicative DNA helicase n=1 Tax=Alicyclobacillus macrosporangiidus TaxID=392015 RepID=UPI00068A7CC7|nr:replicative DNA helicase [Alicyclobacillus macrosporangiidus]
MWHGDDQASVRTAELTMIATLLDRPTLLDEIDLSPADFEDERNALVYQTVTSLYEQGKPVSNVLVGEKLARSLDPQYLAVALNVTYAQPWAAKELAHQIRQNAKRRRLQKAAMRLQEIAMMADEIGDNEMAEVEKAIAQIESQETETSGPRHIGDILRDHVQVLEERYKQKGLVGINTGFRQLNAYTGGWRPQTLCVVAARPSMGKTAFMLHTARAASLNDVAVVFSLEMGDDSIADRLVASEGGVPLYSIHHGRIQDSDWPKLTQAFARLEARNLFVDTQANVSTAYIRAKLRRLARKLPADKRMVVFVDYMQLIQTQRGRSRTEEVGEVSRELKAIAKEMNCCVVALAQLSRAVEQRQDKRPTLADIRESGQIEQDADVIMFLYRDEYYNPNTDTPGIVEVIIGKQRNGPIGTAKLAFSKETQVFQEVRGA